MVALCECGCGEPVAINKESHPGCGRIKGRPNRFVQGHTGKKKHGMSRTPEWEAYAHAKDRCTNPNSRVWSCYGGRGIQFKFESFEEWFAHIGPRPSAQYSQDRINNNGNYEPGNIRWATKEQQNTNRRKRQRNQGGKHVYS
jgi:hypothetical protein